MGLINVCWLDGEVDYFNGVIDFYEQYIEIEMEDGVINIPYTSIKWWKIE